MTTERFKLSYTPSAANKYRVPKKQWAKWSVAAKRVYNEVYECLRDQRVIAHPATPHIKRQEWRTIQFNAAWLAADAVV